MVFITGWEILDIVVMTLAIGFIFSGEVKFRPSYEEDPIKYYKRNQIIEDIKIGAIVAAPAVVLHEMSHKIAALMVGATTAVIHAPQLTSIPYDMYIFVIILKLIGFPLIFFIGGYVAHNAAAGLPAMIVSIAGPFMNLLLYGLAHLLVKKGLVHSKYHHMIIVSGKLNLFLAVFNLIPIPGFDGFHVLKNLGIVLGFF